jgi:hypothetical protein
MYQVFLSTPFWSVTQPKMLVDSEDYQLIVTTGICMNRVAR